jgi:hypothetical protein
MTGSVHHSWWRFTAAVGVLAWLLCSCAALANNGAHGAKVGLQGGINGGVNQQQVAAMIAQEQQMMRELQQLIQMQQRMLGQQGGIGLNGLGVNGLNGLNGLNGNGIRGVNGAGIVPNQANNRVGGAVGHAGHGAAHHHKK